jgi:hypothetical protein
VKDVNRKIVTTSLTLVAVSLITLYFIPVPGAQVGDPKLEYKILTSTHILSAAYKVYGKPDLGLWVAKLVLTNNGTAPLYDLKISYSIDVYSGWSEGERYPVLLPGSSVVDLYYPIISSEVAKLTTPTPSRVRIKITYVDARGTPKEITETRPIEILGVHDFIFTSLAPEENLGTFYDLFNNHPLLAAWVTPTDPVVREYANLGNKIAGGAGATISDQEAWKSLTGMWLLSTYNGIQYKSPPEAFWTGKSSQYVYYPRDVIRDKSGTCIDTALLFASLAMSQGLRSYIVLMPGHAFTLIVLPKSGNIIPIETTALNVRASFEEAVNAGVKVFREAMSGPHIIVDVQGFQAMGVHPPELETLPPDILEKWGIKTPTGSPTEKPPEKPPESLTYTNPSPKWSMSYPQGWTSTQPLPNEVDFTSPQWDALIVVAWWKGINKEDVQATVEAFLRQKGALEVVKKSGVSVSGISADMIVYTFVFDGNKEYIVARYFEYGGYGFALVCEFIHTEMMDTCESIVGTFKLG